MTGPDPDARLYTWADLLLSWQVGRDFGATEGVALARELIAQAVMQALQRPAGQGGPDLEQSAVDTARDLYSRYFNVNLGEPS